MGKENAEYEAALILIRAVRQSVSATPQVARRPHLIIANATLRLLLAAAVGDEGGEDVVISTHAIRMTAAAAALGFGSFIGALGTEDAEDLVEALVEGVRLGMKDPCGGGLVVQ